MKQKNIPIIMTIGGSDCSAGAGIQADIKTITAIGGYATSVITALTAQNTKEVNAIYPVPENFIEKQFYSIASDFKINGIKTGMLYNNDTINCVAKLIKKSNIKNYVLDTVIVASSGKKLVTENTIDDIITKLFPLAKVITPNIPEAEMLLNKKLNSMKEMEIFAYELLKLGPESVLLKGGHLKTKKIIDVFVSKKLDNPIIFSKNKIKTTNTHGTGCTLSAALVTLMSQNYDYHKTIDLLEDYMNKIIKGSINSFICKDNGPLNHFANI